MKIKDWLSKNWKRLANAILNGGLKVFLEVIGALLIAQALGITDKGRFIIGLLVLITGLEHKFLKLIK